MLTYLYMLCIKYSLKIWNAYQKNTPFLLSCKDELLQDETNFRFLGLELDKFMNWKTHVKLMLHILGNSCLAIRNMKYCSNIVTIRKMYNAYFHSIMKYGIIFWGNLPDAKKSFPFTNKDYKDNERNKA
jgi:hypothetical protein